MGNVTMSVPCSTVMRDGLPARNSLLSPLTRVLLDVGVVQLVFQSRFAYAGRDIAVGEHGDHASRNGVVRREIERAVADRGDDRSVAVQVAGRATVGQ